MMNLSLDRSGAEEEEEQSSSPMEELSNLLVRLENRIVTTRENHRKALIEAAKPAPSNTDTTSPVRGFGRFLSRRGSNNNKDARTPKKSFNDTAASAEASPSVSPVRPSDKSQGPIADFISFPEQEGFIEDLRRAAELCIIGENYVTSVQKEEERAKQRAKERWAAARDDFADKDESISQSEDDKRDSEKMQLFDLFFEQNGLAMMVDMLHGESFDLEKNKPAPDDTSKNGTNDSNNNNNNDDGESAPDPEVEFESKTLLPPLPIATQALQSISILIQNVSRATSLYVILSNNYINKLIGLPLNLYTIAERRRQIATKEAKSLPVTFTSPQITEVATHFVTFLKSLALRMNAETLQFFLKYPAEYMEDGRVITASSSHFDGRDSNVATGSGKKESNNLTVDQACPVANVEFPLYERALEFCAAHQDSFVRVTAMNICLNTLRLTTIASSDVEGAEDGAVCAASSPDGVLHNAKPLPFRERLTIAHYACIPVRVERIISPIFTKLAERWSALDEQIRLIDSNKHMGFAESSDDVGVRNERVAVAKEKVRRERLIRDFKNKFADLQDELILLDDVFKVGLTVLNEQLIEMMLATFVYPLLLQPLVLYCQRLNKSVDESRFSFSDHPFGGIGVDLSDVDKTLLQVAGPAKAALFTLSSVFKLLSNRPLLRLLYTVLFHPLSPDSTSAPTVRSCLEVAMSDHKGRQYIRLDHAYLAGSKVPDERTTYAFGTSSTNRRRSKRDLRAKDSDNDDITESLSFVLSPALAEVLEFTGNDVAMISRSRPNSYRRSLLRCLTVPDDMSDIRDLTVGLFDSALSVFEGSFVSTILFGTDLKTFADDIPADERTLDSKLAMGDDRGIGGSAELDSRQSLSQRKGGAVGSDLTNEVVSALCSCVVFARRVASDEWRLGYDEVAAHALLCAIVNNPGAIVSSARLLERRWRQAAIMLAGIPSSGLSPMGGTSITIPGSPSVNDPDYEDRMFESFLNLVFYDSAGLDGFPVAEELLQLKEVADAGSQNCFSIAISCESNFESLTSRVGAFLLFDVRGSGVRSLDSEMVNERREGARAWLKVDALTTLLKDLAATGGLSIRGSPLSGIAFAADGSVVELSKAFDARSVYANLSSAIVDLLFSDCSLNGLPESRSVVDLSSQPAIPCVCEVSGASAQYFVDAVSGLEAEGVTWQSLFIVFLDNFLVFAQPLPDDADGKGRVIASVTLERVAVDQDPAPDIESPARRLSLFYKWFDTNPPPLFLYDALPAPEDHGPFVRVKLFPSRLDVWFENEATANQAYEIIAGHVFMAKSERGRRLQAFLDPQQENKKESFW